MIDTTKKYKTRDDRDVRLYDDDCGGSYPIHGAYLDTFGCWNISSWTALGFNNRQNLSLVEVKPRIKRTVWLNVYSDGPGTVVGHENKDSADRFAVNRLDRIACVKIDIDCEEGEGL